MKAKRRFNIWLWVLLCVPCLLASCDHDVHDGEEEGGLSVSLTWADEADQGTEVKDVKLWIFNADDGSLVEEKHYGSAQEVASQRFALPVGHYQILAATNLIEPFFIGEATRATLNINQLMFGLSNPSASPDHAYYGVTDIGIDKSNVNYITKNEMRHILAELTIFIEGESGHEGDGDRMVRHERQRGCQQAHISPACRSCKNLACEEWHRG